MPNDDCGVGEGLKGVYQIKGFGVGGWLLYCDKVKIKNKFLVFIKHGDKTNKNNTNICLLNIIIIF